MSRKMSALLMTLLVAVAVPQVEAAPNMMRENRIPITVTEAERLHVLTEMREFLHGMHSLQLAMARNDMKAVALVAGDMGALLDKVPPGLRERLPPEFLELAIGQHEVFQAIARDAKAKGDMFTTLGQVGEALTYCSGCHDTYRFQVGRIKPACP